MNKILASLSLAAGLAFVTATASAEAIYDSFSLTNVDGSTSGTVKGEIDFAAPGSNASAVYLYSVPAPLDSFALNTNLLTTTTVVANSLTADAAGLISSGFLHLESGLYGFEINGSGVVDFLQGSSFDVANVGGLAALNFAPIPASVAVPEPVTFGLLTVGLVGLGAARIRAARKQAPKA